MLSMQDAMDRPQLGGVISRILVLSRCSALLRFAGRKDGDCLAFLPSHAAKAEAQEVNLVGWAHATLLLIDLEPHARLQKSPN